METLAPNAPAAEVAVPRKLLTKNDVAALFGITTTSINPWIAAGKIPAPMRIGRRVYWRPETLGVFLDNIEKTNTARGVA